MHLKRLDIALIVLILITAAMHFGAAFDRILFPDGPDPLFTLNGLGYLGLLGAYFLPIGILQRLHKTVWWTFFAYICLTIVAWLIIWVGMNVLANGVPFFSRDSIYGVPAKMAEVISLFLMWRQKP